MPLPFTFAFWFLDWNWRKTNEKIGKALVGMSPWRRQGRPENSLASTALSLICLMSRHHQRVVQVLGSLALWSCPPAPLFPARAILPIIRPPNLAFAYCILNITCNPMLPLPFRLLQPSWLTVVPCVLVRCLSHVPSRILVHPLSGPQSCLPHQLATLLPASVQPRVANTQRCVDGSPVCLLNTSHRKEEWGFAPVKFYLSQTLNPIFLPQSWKMVSIQLSHEECFRLNSAPWRPSSPLQHASCFRSAFLPLCCVKEKNCPSPLYVPPSVPWAEFSSTSSYV